MYLFHFRINFFQFQPFGHNLVWWVGHQHKPFFFLMFVSVLFKTLFMSSYLLYLFIILHIRLRYRITHCSLPLFNDYFYGEKERVLRLTVEVQWACGRTCPMFIPYFNIESMGKEAFGPDFNTYRVTVSVCILGVCRKKKKRFIFFCTKAP